MEAFAVPFLLFVGSLLALQAAANVQLSTATGSPFGASTLQCGVAATLLVTLGAVAGVLGAFGSLDDVETWHLVGGLGTSLYITSGILLFPRLGAVVTVAFWVAGQMLASMALDGFGLLGVEREAPGIGQLLGTPMVIAAAVVIVSAQAGGGALGSALRERTGWLALAVLAGAALPLQGAVNAQLRADLDAPIAAAAFSFIVASSAMLVVLAGSIALANAARPRVRPLATVPWWGWLGGVCGATYVTSVFLLIPEIGTAATIALTVAGQQVASLFVDRYGLFRLPRRRLSMVRLAGVATLLLGVGLIQVT
jgi:bacterial/archaeal transporter family-2 protein